MTAAMIQRSDPTPDLADVYRRMGVSEMARQAGVSRDVIYGRLKDAGVILDAQRRGNLAQRRECPTDFGKRYVELGLDGCIDHYAARKDVVRRWRDETGRDDLRAARNLHLQRDRPPAVRTAAMGGCPRVTPETELERAAAQWLRYPRNGGWVVTKQGPHYRVGTMPMTPVQLVEFATKKGFRP